MKTRWLPFATYQTKAQLRLLCFSHAGGNARVFRRWGEAISGEVEVCPVELPGRGTRLGEGLVSSMPLLVETMAAEIEPLLDLPFAIFGHSMGGLVGFELARTLRRVYGREPAALLVAAQNAPSVPLERPTAQRCTDGELSEPSTVPAGCPKRRWRTPGSCACSYRYCGRITRWSTPTSTHAKDPYGALSTSTPGRRTRW